MKKGICNTILILLLALTVNAQTPVADFSGSVLSGCAPLRVSFRDLSSGDPKYWDWDLGNGVLSNQKNPGVTYSAPGTYTVTLVVRNANGANAVTKTDYITVFPSPSVSLSANITTACLPASIQFSGNATTTEGSITGWEWAFGDSTTSTAQNPRHTYTETGYYTVSLTATSSNGCTGRAVRSRYIRMVSGIVADFVSAPTMDCRPPFAVSFTNESSGPGNLTYSWNFGNGNTSASADPVASFSESGDYPVQLITQSNYGCKDTVQKTVQLITNAGGFNSPDSICIAEPVNFQNTSTPGANSFVWDFGDGTQSTTVNPSKTYGAIGTYTVKLINRYPNCNDTVSRQLKITPKAPVNFTATNNIGCGIPLTVQFQDLTPNAVTWLWNFGDGTTSNDPNPSHTYTNVASYDVSLTVTTVSGCGNTIIKPGFVRVIPTTVKITSDVLYGDCVPFAVHPVAEVRSVDGIASYLWDFGDGFTSTAQNPTHTYTSTGEFAMQVTVTTVGGCVATAVYPIKAGVPPTDVDFSMVSNAGPCVSDTVRFAATATGANEWLWDFGDKTSSKDQNPFHLYRDTGTFTVRVTAYNNGCAAPSVSKSGLFHKEPPVSNFGYEVNCSNRLSVTFTDSSIVDPALGTPAYSWDFGDGATSTERNPPPHVYSGYGKYNVNLTVVNGSCTAFYTQEVNLFTVEVDFAVSAAVLCKNQLITFTAPEDTSKVAQYTWTVDGFIAGDEQTFDTLFQSAGDHEIALVMLDKNDCAVEVTKKISVKGPTAKFSSSVMGACGNTAVTFSDESTSGTGINEWIWDFGDSTTQSFSAPPFTHQYADTGSFLVKLMVKDVDGCTDAFALTDSIRVTAPKAWFGALQTMACPGIALPFLDSSSGKALTYAWDFGDGQTSTEQSPAHLYADGTYTVKLVVKDSLGCADSLVRTDYVTVATPIAAFDAQDTSSTCELLETKFFSKSQNYESLTWDFGDSTGSSLTDPRHFYDVYGTYHVKLYANGYGGCVDTATGQVNVYNPFVYTKINYTVPSSVCNEIAVAFDVETPPGTSFTFGFGDGVVDSSGATSLQHTYDYPNSYRPVVFLTDALDCRVNVNGSTLINVKGAVPIFNIDKRAFCDSGTIFVTNYSLSNEPIVAQLWNFGDGQTSAIEDPPSHNYPQSGLYPVSLTATTVSGCERTFYDTVRVLRTPDPVINAPDLSCINRGIVFNGTLSQPPDTAIQWSWNFGDGRTSNERNNNISYANPGNYNVTLVAANSLGCKDTAMHAMAVAPLPVITMPDVTTLLVGSELIMPVSYSSGITRYAWSPSEGLSCTQCPNPTAKPKLTTTYTVLVTDSNTCTNTGNITVDVVCKAENYFVPNTFSPNGDGMNEVFYPRGRGLASVQSMKIFNRWGQVMMDRRNFAANDPSSGWNGTFGGKPLPPDVYVYLIEFVCENGQIVQMKGNVTLIR